VAHIIMRADAMSWGRACLTLHGRPRAPPLPCRHPGCPALTPTGYCEKHPKSPAWHSSRPVDRPHGPRDQRLRRRSSIANRSANAVSTLVATIRDHVRPLAEGGTDDADNIQLK